MLFPKSAENKLSTSSCSTVYSSITYESHGFAYIPSFDIRSLITFTILFKIIFILAASALDDIFESTLTTDIYSVGLSVSRFFFKCFICSAPVLFLHAVMPNHIYAMPAA